MSILSIEEKKRYYSVVLFVEEMQPVNNQSPKRQTELHCIIRANG